MASTKRTEHEIQAVDPLSDRVVTQQIDYLAQDGRRITQPKLDAMQNLTKATAEFMADALGFEVVYVSTKRY